MTKPLFGFFICLSLFAGFQASDAASPIEELFEQRIRSVVVIEFFVEREIDRRPLIVNGVVLDDEGLILLPENSVPNWVPVNKLKEFKAYIPGDPEVFTAEYLGSDRSYGRHFVRVEESLIPRLVPISEYKVGEPLLGQAIWGIGIAAKDLDFMPFFMRAEVSTIQPLPELIGFATYEVASPGALVFSDGGSMVGWASTPLNMERILTIEGKRYKAYMKIPDQTSTFYIASEWMETVSDPPESPDSYDASFIGTVGLNALNDEVAEHMGLADQSAIAVSEILNDSPAKKAGLQERDIITSLDGESFNRYVPRRVVVSYFEQEIAKRNIGDVLNIGVLRNGEPLDVEVTIESHPKLARQADRRYFESIGLTIREFVVTDRISLGMPSNEDDEPGVIVNFVKTNSNAYTAGVKSGDLIKEIEGEAVSSFSQVVSKLEEILEMTDRKDFVILVGRRSETSVLRISLE